VHVKNGVELINKSGTSLSEIRKLVEEFAHMMKEISNATIEQSTGLEQINTAIAVMDDMTQKNGILVQNNTSTAQDLREQAQVLIEEGHFFKVD
jgi:methyl-accepting chemotaxis protein